MMLNFMWCVVVYTLTDLMWRVVCCVYFHYFARIVEMVHNSRFMHVPRLS